MNRRTSANGLHGLVAITAAFTIGLHQIGGISGFTIDWADPVGWLNSTATEDVIGAALRQIGLVIAYWILGSTALYVVSGMRGRGHRPRWVTLMTHRWIRKVADRALAATLAVSVLTPQFGIALADAPAPPPPIVFEATTDGIPVPHVGMATVGEAPGEAAAEVQIAPPQPILLPPTIPALSEASELSEPTQPTTTHTVATGDNLWTIAATYLEATLDVAAEQSVVSRYWQRVIDANVATLRSGDPNLIYPGELVTLPHIGDTP